MGVPINSWACRIHSGDMGYCYNTGLRQNSGLILVGFDNFFLKKTFKAVLGQVIVVEIFLFQYWKKETPPFFSNVSRESRK